MGFKDGIIILLFIFVLFKFLKPLGSLLGESSALLKGPAGALLAITLLFYVLDAFLNRQGAYFPTTTVQGIAGITEATITSRPRTQKYLYGDIPSKSSSQKKFPFGTPPTQVGRSGSFSRNFFRKR